MKNLVKSIKALNKDEKINFQYDSKDYVINCFYKDRKGNNIYSVYRDGNKLLNEAMNVEKITNKYITLYSYDMMSNRTTYKMNIDKITLI